MELNIDYVQNFPFYRCRSCNALLTAEQEINSRKDGKLCSCGGVKYSPGYPNDAEWESDLVKNFCAKFDLERDPAEYR